MNPRLDEPVAHNEPALQLSQPQPDDEPAQQRHEPCAEALDAIGWTSFSTELFLLAGLGWISDGAEASVLSYMLPALSELYSLSGPQLGEISSLFSGCQAFGALFWGWLADTAGRRPAFLGSVGLTAIFGIASAFAPSLLWYVVLRAATGFAIGGNLPLAVTVSSELLPPRHRDRALLGLHLFYEVGALCSTSIASILLPKSCVDASRCDWPWYLSCVSLPAAAVSLVAIVRLPESAVWLSSRGKHESARQVLLQILRRSTGCGYAQRIDQPLPLDLSAALPTSGTAAHASVCAVADVASSTSTAATASTAASSSSMGHAESQEGPAPRDQSESPCDSPRDASSTFAYRSVLPTGLVSSHMLRTTLCVSALWLIADASSGWWTWLPTIAAKLKVPSGIMYAASIVGRVVASCAFLVATAAISCLSARTLLTTCVLACSALSALLGVWVATPTLFATPSFVAVYGIFAFFFGGLWSLMYVFTPACFPPSLRGSGFGLASAAAKIGQLASPLVVGELISTGEPWALGTFFTSGFALSTLCLLLVPRRVPGA